MQNANQHVRASTLVGKIANADYPVGHAKRRRLLRRILRMYAAHFRTVRNDQETAQNYERAARRF